MRSLKLFYIIGSVLLIIYLVAEYNRPIAVNWKPTLSYQDKIPFGTYILYHELHQLFKDAEITGTNQTFYDQFHRSTASTVVHTGTDSTASHAGTDSLVVHSDSASVNIGTDSLAAHNDTAIKVDTNRITVKIDTERIAVKSNYIIIANSVNIGKLDFRAMVNYMNDGNSIFIATDGFVQTGLNPNFLADTLKLELSHPRIVEKNTETLNFTNGQLRRKEGYRFDRGIASGYFEKFDTTRAVVLSQNESGNATLLCYKFGKGNLFLCADPKLFTNYSLLKNPGAEYASKALSYMTVQPVIYWDHMQNGDIPEDESPVRVFFNNPSLRWAYYIALFGMVGFVLYEMKRRQRIIPVIEPLANSTVDFVNVVGRVYYEQRNNTNIAQKKILYFLEHLRNTYYLKTSKLDKEFIERMSQKTGVDLEFAQELVAHVHYVTGQRVSDQDLIKLNQLIEQFYIKSR